ncbi:MAG: cytidine deaminase [Saprospiraceae bacterium]|jgi:cytidine deaminase|nr:cytidine deaminase [Saprospiraceae bacterium]
MKTISCQFEYKIYESIEELSVPDRELMLMAVEELKNAYAPYSNFHVGAAVRLNDQSVYIGSNQENASYPLCMCGERVALYNAAANKPFVPIESLAITIKNLNMIIAKPVSPCGACRQVISEYEFRHRQAIRIFLKSDNDEVYVISSVNDLLPLGFNASFL